LNRELEQGARRWIAQWKCRSNFHSLAFVTASQPIYSGEEDHMPDAIDDLFRRFGKAFNKADVEEIAACVTDDFEWRLAAGGRPSGQVLKGKEQLRSYFADKSRAHREARYSEARIHRSGDKLFGTFRVTGIDAAGQAFDRYGIDLYELKDGKIALKDSYLKVD
jgi:ketosteroid isomerase-like protein